MLLVEELRPYSNTLSYIQYIVRLIYYLCMSYTIVNVNALDLLEEPLLTVGDSCGDCGLLEVGLAAGDFCCCCCASPAEGRLPLTADACNIQLTYTYPLYSM